MISIAPGAKISTIGKGGRVLLAAQNIDNAGEIDTPDGQVILAAGEKVYLQASTDPSLRGLLVEVDAGGEAFNRMTGSISAARGNVTMVGLAVNQQGRVSATSTVSANGSIRLLARDTVRVAGDDQNPLFAATRGGRARARREQPDHGHPGARRSHHGDRRTEAASVDRRTRRPPALRARRRPGARARRRNFAAGAEREAHRGERNAVRWWIPRRASASNRARCSMLRAATPRSPCRATWCAWSCAATSFATIPTQRDGPLRGQDSVRRCARRHAARRRQRRDRRYRPRHRRTHFGGWDDLDQVRRRHLGGAGRGVRRLGWNTDLHRRRGTNYPVADRGRSRSRHRAGECHRQLRRPDQSRPACAATIAGA